MAVILWQSSTRKSSPPVANLSPSIRLEGVFGTIDDQHHQWAHQDFRGLLSDGIEYHPLAIAAIAHVRKRNAESVPGS
jgi:hypothetical protein